MTFPRMVAAAGAGAVLAFVGRIALGLGWESNVPMMRELLFLAGLDSILIAVLFGLLATFVAKGKPGRAFLLGLAAGAAPWSLISFPIAIVVVAVLWKFMPPMPARITWIGGALAFLLAPLALLMPIVESLYPAMPTPDPIELTADAPAANPGSPDVVLIVCDTLRADAILDPEVPTPNLDALRATGAWSKGAVAPANQTLPSHLSLLFALDIEHVGMRNNRSRWPSRKNLRDEVQAKSMAQRFTDAGYRTQAVASNKLLSSGEGKPGEVKTNKSNQWMSDGFHSWWNVSRDSKGFVRFLRWSETNSLIGFLASHQIGIKKRPLNFFLKRMTIKQSLNGYRMHFEEGESTVAAVQQSLQALTVDDRPYFLFTNFMEPHDPYLPPPAFAGTIAKAEDLPQGFLNDVDGEFRMRRQVHVSTLNKRGAVSPEVYLPTGEFLQDLYHEEVAYFDSLLGRTLEIIRATGRPTVILFVSDHGEGFGVHLDPAHGHTLFESEISVPFILNGPGVPEGVELPFTPELVDGSRTLLELAGVNTKFADGHNVLSPDFKQHATMTFREGQISTFDGRWKLHANFKYDNDTPKDQIEGREVEKGRYQLEALYLFDLIADPGEANNLLEQHPLEATRLLAAIEERLKSDIYPKISPRELTDEEQAELDALGYVGHDDSPSATNEDDH
ncbi:MAG: sulfatase-like hydrolase/transferase [Planctomycetes bacterium]|nr:sulfatase-like hydrolase/transferase [Planctomycetota bacterium]MCP4771168.1 sulfatase-like hydrolase/transferase [Planctomycetota bacterium]MCP4862105.1 sulfatase-like hydrolase/transferase [Planctomycetota bacterium]